MFFAHCPPSSTWIPNWKVFQAVDEVDAPNIGMHGSDASASFRLLFTSELSPPCETRNPSSTTGATQTRCCTSRKLHIRRRGSKRAVDGAPRRSGSSALCATCFSGSRTRREALKIPSVLERPCYLSQTYPIILRTFSFPYHDGRRAPPRGSTRSSSGSRFPIEPAFVLLSKGDLSRVQGRETLSCQLRLCATNAIAMRVMELPRASRGATCVFRSVKQLSATANRAGKRLERSGDAQVTRRKAGSRGRDTTRSKAAMQQSSSPQQDTTLASHGYKLDAQDRAPSEGTGKQRKLVFVASEVRLGDTKSYCRSNLVATASRD